MMWLCWFMHKWSRWERTEVLIVDDDKQRWKERGQERMCRRCGKQQYEVIR
jgi:hypothetical protein